MRRRVWLLLFLWRLFGSHLQSSFSSLALSPSNDGLVVIHSTIACSSSVVAEGSMAELTPDLMLHWKYTPSSDHLQMAMESDGSTWVAVAFSPTGRMANSKAFVGLPQKAPQLYALRSDASPTDVASAIQPVDDSIEVDLQFEGGVVSRSSGTLMTLTLTGLSQIQVPDANGLWTMLYAIGMDGNLGLHAHRGAFKVDLNYCEKLRGTINTGDATSSSSTTSATYDHKGLFAAHGFFATMSFAVIVPCSVSAAWFRALMPKWWIYVHVLCNCVAFFLTFLAVLLAFSGMVMRHQSNETAVHMSLAHHWVGLILFILVLYQLFNGFRRPPVEPKVENTISITYPNMITPSSSNGDGFADDQQPRYCCGCLKCQTPREKWHSLHRVIAFIVLIMALFQLSSGTKLFSDEYTSTDNSTANNSALVALWIWIALLIFTIGCVKCWLHAKEKRATSASHMVLRQLSETSERNLMPQRPEDDDRADEEDFIPQAETRAFTNII